MTLGKWYDREYESATGRNEVTAREGIDTFSLIDLSGYTVTGRNEVTAREGIDTDKYVDKMWLDESVEMR